MPRILNHQAVWKIKTYYIIVGEGKTEPVAGSSVYRYKDSAEEDADAEGFEVLPVYIIPVMDSTELMNGTLMNNTISVQATWALMQTQARLEQFKQEVDDNIFEQQIAQECTQRFNAKTVQRALTRLGIQRKRTRCNMTESQATNLFFYKNSLQSNIMTCSNIIDLAKALIKHGHESISINIDDLMLIDP